MSAELEPTFPLINSNILTPDQGDEGRLAICTNTLAPGLVLNELGEVARDETAVLGSLIVCRDGTERLILNSLVHPTLTDVVLFGGETQSFAPSTNLLNAIMYGIDPEDGSNRIINGVGSAPQYPNLDSETLALFGDTITALPLFTSERPTSRKTVEEYIAWLGDRIDPDTRDILEKSLGKKAYFDRLNELAEVLAAKPQAEKQIAQLDPKDYQHLQPPIRILEPREVTLPAAQYKVTANKETISATLRNGEANITVSGQDEFAVAFTIMRELGENKTDLSPLEQLTLGAELGRAGVVMRNEFDVPPLSVQPDISGEPIELLPARGLITDKDYYYKVGITDGMLSVTCMANDTCEDVFELRGNTLEEVLDELARLNRFEDYEMDILHRLDVGMQLGRADLARQHGFEFVQDFAPIFKVNTESLPFVVVESDTFLGAHRNLILRTYTEGLSAEHADAQKGTARTIGALVVLRNVQVALVTMPRIYRQGSEPVETTRAAYADQLRRFDHDGNYSYGERTRAYWGHDQLETVVGGLRANPDKAVIIQRYDPSVDMGMEIQVDGSIEYTHDPCLTHDVFWLQDGKLHSLHIARAHNFVNAYPENVFGLYDAYVSKVRDELGAEGGDMFMFSSRGNILMLTEEQKAKSLIVEPTKPFENTEADESGPHWLESNQGQPGLSYLERDMSRSWSQHHNTDLITSLTNYRGADIIDRAIQYLKNKGGSHNNVVLSDFIPGESELGDSFMPFLQANVYGDKLYLSAVFTNRSHSQRELDFETINYIGNLFAQGLDVELGKAVLMHIGDPNV